MIDWARIKMLRDEIGEEDFPEVVEIFIEEVSMMIDSLRSAPRLDTLGANLHALKGSALNLGFNTFAEMCQRGESAAADGRAGEIVLEPILRCYEDSRDIFLSGLDSGLAA